MNLFQAEEIAQRLMEQMQPHCTRIQVAGSIRRQSPQVKDIEIVCIPRWAERPDPSDLFGEPIPVNTLFTDWATAQVEVSWIKPATEQVVPWAPKPEGKYWRGLLNEGIKLDLFLVNPDNWGYQLALRTGCAEFSRALVIQAKATFNHSPSDGYLRGRDGRELVTPTEREVFDLLRLEWIEPERRGSAAAERILRYCHRVAA